MIQPEKVGPALLFAIILAFSAFLSSQFILASPTHKVDSGIEEAPKIPSVEGIWENEQSQAYTVKRKIDVYVVQSTTGDVGIGRLEGNKFIVSFAGSQTKVGLAVYQIDNTGKILKLVGEWTTIPGNGKWDTETLTKIK